MSHPLISTWTFSDAGLTLTTLHDRDAHRVGLSFACARGVDRIDASIEPIFRNAIAGEAFRDIRPVRSPEGINERGNRRGALAECRCETLNRLTHPARRTAYEDRVIAKVLEMGGDTTAPFHFKLAIFASGGLLGEQILLFRLLDKVKDRSGTLEVFFIDQCYEPMIRDATHRATFEEALGREESVQQFLREFCHCLPSTLTLRGTFFASARSYLQMARMNLLFKHHLLIGADIEDANRVVGQIGREAGIGAAQPMVLMHASGAELGQLTHFGTLVDREDLERGDALSEPSGGLRKRTLLLGATVVTVFVLLLLQLRKL